MARKNGKQQIIDYEDSIKKSNEFSMARFNRKLTLNQMQLLAYAIYCTQQNGKTEFHKADFEKKFGLTRYNTVEARKDRQKLHSLDIITEDADYNYDDYLHVFQRITYKNGLFTFQWADDIKPHILDLKDRYITNGMPVIASFKSGFSLILYDYLKAHYGYWRKALSKEALMKLFGVEDKKTYLRNTADFKKMVLDFAITEINDLTELEVYYKEQKEGRRTVGFDLIWSTGTNVKSATKKQIKELKTIVDTAIDDSSRLINLNDEDNRVHAISMVEEIRDMQAHTGEPIHITASMADKLIFKAQDNVRVLHKYLDLENKPQRKDMYYNWLDDNT